MRPIPPLRRLLSAALMVCVAASAAAWAAPGLWKLLAEDGVHDPRNPGLAQLQQPADALKTLPGDFAGNMVNWVKAIESGAINPRTSILPETVVRTLDQDIIISKYGSMPAVKFPHRQHTLWLDCSNCHDQLFKPKIGANKFSMVAILNGEQCGLCHGAVSFPLTECNRCHSVSNDVLRRQAQAAAAASAAAARGDAAASGAVAR